MFYSNRKAFTLECIMRINLFTKQKQSHRSRKQTYGYQRKGRGGVIWETGIDIYTLLYIKQITNKKLLYAQGTQHSL